MNYYLLVDCNNFFVSCERVFRPDLNGKPVVVLSSNDGCVIARSNEAKNLDIAMGVPYFKVRSIIERNRGTIFSSNHALYSDFSRRVMSILRQVSPAVEVYSIDEAFVYMHGMRDDFDISKFAKQLVKLIYKSCGIPVSVGIAPTKTLAKMGAKLVKRSLMCSDGVSLLGDAQTIESALKNTKIDDIWGIGQKSVVKLRRNGIESAFDFINVSPTWIKANLSITGLRTWHELRAQPAIDFNDENFSDDSRQSIMVSRSFTKEISDFDTLSSALAKFSTSMVAKLRNQHSATYQITVFAHTNRFAKNQPFYCDSAIHNFEVATDNLMEIADRATRLLKSIYRADKSYKKTGIVATKLISKRQAVSTLFDQVDRGKQNSLMSVIDNINSRHGKNSIVTARCGFDSVPVSGQNISPSYTTSWSDIMCVK